MKKDLNKIMFFIFKAAFIAFIIMQVGLILINVGFGMFYFAGARYPIPWEAVFIPTMIIVPAVTIILILAKVLKKGDN